MKVIRVAFLLLVLSVASAVAHSFRLGAIEIGHPWAPPSDSHEAAVYLALSNLGAAPDRLIAASSPRANAVELRGGDDTVLKEIVVAPGRPIALRAGRPHLALHGLTRPLAAGEEFPLTLSFAGAGSIEVTVTVETTPGE